MNSNKSYFYDECNYTQAITMIMFSIDYNVFKLKQYMLIIISKMGYVILFII